MIRFPLGFSVTGRSPATALGSPDAVLNRVHHWLASEGARVTQLDRSSLAFTNPVSFLPKSWSPLAVVASGRVALTEDEGSLQVVADFSLTHLLRTLGVFYLVGVAWLTFGAGLRQFPTTAVLTFCMCALLFMRAYTYSRSRVRRELLELLQPISDVEQTGAT